MFAKLKNKITQHSENKRNYRGMYVEMAKNQNTHAEPKKTLIVKDEEGKIYKLTEID
jgi:hypothetical protein